MSFADVAQVELELIRQRELSASSPCSSATPSPQKRSNRIVGRGRSEGREEGDEEREGIGGDEGKKGKKWNVYHLHYDLLGASSSFSSILFPPFFFILMIFF